MPARVPGPAAGLTRTSLGQWRMPAQPVPGPMADGHPGPPTVPGTNEADVCPPVPGPAAGPSCPFRDRWQTPAHPSRDPRRARPTRPRGIPVADACLLPPIPGPAGRAPPARPRNQCGRFPPVPGPAAGPARPSGTRGGPGLAVPGTSGGRLPALLGPAAGPARPSRDQWWTLTHPSRDHGEPRPGRPVTSGGRLPPVPGPVRVLPARPGMSLRTPARHPGTSGGPRPLPVPGPVADACPPVPRPVVGPAHPVR
ncbi:basic proline-rich protein-like [Macrobrachium nipponense]|uniref:basic proline-rich protein-like n=1 Tax=Macrobrachium nipponense TaxID=159736 RepID=UPI0030C8172E